LVELGHPLIPIKKLFSLFQEEEVEEVEEKV
jgi:hypothetical protein